MRGPTRSKRDSIDRRLVDESEPIHRRIEFVLARRPDAPAATVENIQVLNPRTAQSGWAAGDDTLAPATSDADGNGVVDFTELASGLSVLCSGTRCNDS